MKRSGSSRAKVWRRSRGTSVAGVPWRRWRAERAARISEGPLGSRAASRRSRSARDEDALPTRGSVEDLASELDQPLALGGVPGSELRAVVDRAEEVDAQQLHGDRPAGPQWQAPEPVR